MLKHKPYPKTRTVDAAETINGIKVEDPYRWLEKDDSPEVGEWVKEQNAFTRSILDNTASRDAIRDRLNQLFRIDTVGVPVPRGRCYFFQERKGGEELSVLYVQEGLGGSPRVLVDPNMLSDDKSTVLRGWYPSDDGKLLTYGLSEAANDQASIYVLDVRTGKKLPDVIPAEVYPSPHSSIKWNPDNTGFWYTHRHPDAPKGDEKFHQKVYYHKLGQDFKDDLMVFGEDIAKEDIPYIEVSRDGRYLLVTIYKPSGSIESTALYLYDFKNQAEGFTPIIEDKEALFFGALHRDRVYIHTNHNAPFWKLLSASVEDVVRNERNVEDWDVVIPESEYKLENFILIKDVLLAGFLENVHSVFRRYELNGKFVSEVPLPVLGSLTRITREEEGDEFFFGFTSFLVSHDIYRFNIIDGKISIFKRAEAGIDTDMFKVEQVKCISKDGTSVPIFLVYKKGLKLNGNNPTFLYGYGGFNASMTPVFKKDAIPFIEQGGVYAVANIRGGGEFGEEWRRAGTRERKQNVFDDFIAAAEWLISQNYTNSNRLAIFGWSNGGLLMGAAVTQRPDLFKVVVIGAPVIDMVRYHLFFGGRHWISEYGSIEEPELVKPLLAYSPYHNVNEGTNYPAILIVTADKDDRVHPMHAYKMAARLQAANISSNPILLRIEMKAGHVSAPAVSRSVNMFADIWGFVFDELGVRYS